MNISHKCHFHPQQVITKFCSDKQCTLPLCALCENIHLEEHQNQSHPPNIIRFSDAYHHAIQDIEDFLEHQRKEVRERGQQLETDRENVLKYIDNYYSNAAKMIEDVKGKCHQIQDKLSKLKKGSIKTLIFYYSGDIELEKQCQQIEPLINRLKIAQQHNNQPNRNIHQRYLPIVPLIAKPEHIHNERRQYIETSKKIHQEGQRKPKEQGNAFEAIEQIKIGERNRQKTRKSIFQPTKKSMIIEHPQVKEHSPKYNYNKNPSIQNQEQSDVAQSIPTFNDLPKTYTDIPRTYNELPRTFNDAPRNFNDYPKTLTDIPKSKETYEYRLNQLPLHNKQQKPSNYNYELQPPVSFQNRYGNKFSGNEQYQIYKRQRQQKVFKDLTYHNKSVDQKQNIVIRTLKPSDLDVDKLHDNYRNNQLNTYQNSSVQTPLTSQRLRSVSQTHITSRDVRDVGKQTMGYDLKKQVLPPQQIRKMLQKRIQQRNRILSIKKGQNTTPTAQDRQANRKIWQTKDSIINQIYNDTKY